MKDKKKKMSIIFLFVLIVCLIYLYGRATYTSYESQIAGESDLSVAGIHLAINGVDVVSSDSELNDRVILDNTTWVSTHTRAEKISPGSSGTIDLELDPSGSEVAILYEFQFIDKTIDDDKLITFGNITTTDGIVRTSEDTYTGIITLNDIQNNRTFHLSVEFFFDYLNDIEGITEDNQVLDDLFEIHFHAIQYNGETITEYTGE